MIYITNPFMLLPVVAICSVDALLWLMCLRIVFGRASNSFCDSVRRITDLTVDATRKLSARCFEKALPSWACWLIVVVGLLALRQVLIRVLI